jgi:serine O-acetyltransferase
MLAKIIIERFGGFWSVKRYIQKNDTGIKVKFLKALYKFYLYENAADIAISSQFENTPCTPHGERGIFVSGLAKVGKNAVIFQQVTIGSISLVDSKGMGAPTIGDNCYIGAGAKIVGNIKVGDNVRIGANAVVYKDVPDNSIVVSGEMRVIQKSSTLNNRYYSYDDKAKAVIYFEDGEWKREGDEEIVKRLSSL